MGLVGDSGFCRETLQCQYVDAAVVLVELRDDLLTTKYFRADLFPGSLNVDIDSRGPNLHQQRDRGEPLPAFIIPRRELRAMSPYLGDAQTWRVSLSAARMSTPHECWVFRRIGSKVPAKVLEIVSTVAIVTTFGVRHGEDLELLFLPDIGKLA